MKKLMLLLVAFLFAAPLVAEDPARFFNDEDLALVGVYYYPEHWPESQWERDIAKVSELGFDYIHFGEFAWAMIEPSEGVYDFAWLDRAVALADKYGLKVIMCTSIATPPVWLTRAHPDILIQREDGTTWDHGARQHPSSSSNYFRQYALKMVEKVAEHYGKDKRIIGWQLDNEPRVALDYSPDSNERFRQWLKEKYGTIEALNKAWGTPFWSQVYSDFSQINVPQLHGLFTNNHQILDFQIFSTNEIASFLDEQARIIRKHNGGKQWITTNYIPAYEEGHLRMSDELDFHSYTRYMVYGENFGIGRKGYRLGHVERIAMANDFFRPIDGTYGVMELQPGQVNWGQINPQPIPGAMRLWLWHVFAGESRFIVTYRFRQPIYGTELYHYGIIGPDGVTVSNGGEEYRQFMQELDVLRKEYNPKAKNPADYEARRTAILYNYENTLGMEHNKQTSQWSTLGHIEKYYNALKKFNAPVDIIDERADFSKYNVMIAPAFQQLDRDLVARWRDYVENGGNLVLTARSGHKNRNAQLWEAPFGEPIYSLIGAKIDFYDLLLPNTPDDVVVDGKKYPWVSWAEILSPEHGTEVWGIYEGDFYAGRPGIIFQKLGKGTVTYVGVDSIEGEMEHDVLKKLYSRLGIPVMELPEGMHIEYRDGFGIAVNYSDKTLTVPVGQGVKFLVGTKDIPVAGVSVWKY